MKALRFRTHWKVDLTDEPEPQPGPGEVILEVDAVGICGSDVHGFAGITDRRKPGVVMGHEIPEQLGPRVQDAGLRGAGAQHGGEAAHEVAQAAQVRGGLRVRRHRRAPP